MLLVTSVCSSPFVALTPALWVLDVLLWLQTEVVLPVFSVLASLDNAELWALCNIQDPISRLSNSAISVLYGSLRCQRLCTGYFVKAGLGHSDAARYDIALMAVLCSYRQSHLCQQLFNQMYRLSRIGPLQELIACSIVLSFERLQGQPHLCLPLQICL